MPRLGNDNDALRRRGGGNGGSGGDRSASGGGDEDSLTFARTLQSLPKPKLNLRNLILGIVGIFIIRNLLFNDYRKEAMKSLEDSGMTDEEIGKVIPKTYEERREQLKKKGTDMDQMKKDIDYLKNEIDELKKEGRDSTLTEMDLMHMEKRQRNEEKLAKEYPDFKPSPNRLRHNNDSHNKAVATE